MSRCILAFCAGVLALHVLPALGSPLPAAGAAVLAVLAGRRFPCIAGALAGFALAHAVALHALASRWPCDRDRAPAEITGRVAAPALVRDGRVDFDLAVTGSSATPPVPRRVRLAWYDADRVPSAGERWRFGVRMRCPRGFANPGAPDRELSLLRDGIDATGYVAGDVAPRRLDSAAGGFVQRLRERIARAIATALPEGASASVLQGLAVGVRGNIPDALWEAFAVTGIAHLMAISGLHVTGCAMAVLALLGIAWRVPACARLRQRVWIETGVVVAATAAYAVLSGSSTPALRTLASVAILRALRAMRRSVSAAQVLAIAACLLVATDPLSLTSAGFWLSFVATAALLLVMSAGRGVPARLVEFTRAQSVITVLLTPVVAASFGRLSLVAPLANAVAIPAFSFVVLPAVLTGAVLAAIAPGASALVWRALAALLDRAWPALESIAAWPGASWAPASVSLVVSSAAVALGFAACMTRVPGLRAAAAVFIVAALTGAPSRPATGAFALTVIDVGQGLAAVVETAGHALVFDSGPAWYGGAPAARVSLLPYLRARGLRAIDRLVVSHDDLDHAGGVEILRRNLSVHRLMAAPGSRLRADETCMAGTVWNWDGVKFRVVHPPAGFAGSDNDRSCALRVEGPGGSALLLADPESAAEASLAGADIKSDLVLIPHHGSRHSSSPPLIAAAGARFAIASAGFGNRWGMPAPDAVARWRESGATVLPTAAEGAITVEFAPGRDGISIGSERRDNPRWWRVRPPG